MCVPAHIDLSPGAPGDDLSSRLRVVATRVDRLSTREVLGGALTRTQFSVLGALARHDRLRVSDIAGREGLNQTMVSRTLGQLESSGWATRSTDPEDGRAVVAAITPAGRSLHQRLQRDRSMLIQQHLDQLPPDQLAALVAALPVLEGLADHLLRTRGDGAARG